MYYRLPQREIMDGKIKGKFCSHKLSNVLIYNFLANMWTPYAKRFVGGNIFLSPNFFCFRSDVRDLVSLVIPLRRISVRKKLKSN